tara:strand:+ start:544 stop:792 length:249 start_codon:yes stop_codon:yes gene_type:complete
MITITRVANGWILERGDEGEESPARQVYADAGLNQDQQANSLAQLINEAFAAYMQSAHHGGLRVSVTATGYETQEELNKLFS